MIAPNWQKDMLGYLLVRLRSEQFYESVARGKLRASITSKDNVQGHLAEHIFQINQGYCVYFRSTLDLKLG